jgi:hypothetical protein
MGRIAWTSFLAALVGSLILASPAAAKDKPDAALKTRTIDASVSIDPALKAYRGLYSRLLASGKRQMETSRADADQDYRENPKLFSAVGAANSNARSARNRPFGAMSASWASITALRPARRTRTG